MTPDDLLRLLFTRVEKDESSTVKSYLKRWGPEPGLPKQFDALTHDADASAFARLVWVAVRADRRAMASAAGHQAAIRRLFPDTPRDAITAFCISEEHGPRPSKIVSSLTRNGDGWQLNGSKRWGSMAPDADMLYVAASVGRDAEGRNKLRMVALPAEREGVSKDDSSYAEKYPDMRIADLAFDNVLVDAREVFDVDAYDTYIKPFRLIEDVYGTAALQVALVRLGCEHDWPKDVLEDLAGLVVQAHTISETAMETAEEVVLISTYFRASSNLWERLSDCWSSLHEDERAKWQPDHALLDIAARARETRRQNAWQEIDGRA